MLTDEAKQYQKRFKPWTMKILFWSVKARKCVLCHLCALLSPLQSTESLLGLCEAINEAQNLIGYGCMRLGKEECAALLEWIRSNGRTESAFNAMARHVKHPFSLKRTMTFAL